MWTVLTRRPSPLQELIALMREQNGLLRELLSTHTGRPAQTPRTPLSPSSGPGAASSRKRTAADVTVAQRLPADEQAQRNREQAAVAPAAVSETATPLDHLVLETPPPGMPRE